MNNNGVEFHDKLADSWNDGYKKRSFNKRLFLFSKLFKMLIKPNSKWLDAGCGSGSLSRELACHGACVDSIDGSSKMIMHAIEDSKKYMTSISYKKVNFIT